MSKAFGQLSRGKQREVIQVGNGILTADISGTPKTSPLSITTSISTIAIPTNAAEMVVLCPVDIRISEDSDMSQYFKLPANVEKVIPVADLDNIYIRGDAASSTLQFYFVTV